MIGEKTMTFSTAQKIYMGVKRTIDSMPYIIPASKSGTYSKLERAEKREMRKLKKELKDYTKR